MDVTWMYSKGTSKLETTQNDVFNLEIIPNYTSMNAFVPSDEYLLKNTFCINQYNKYIKLKQSFIS